MDPTDIARWQFAITTVYHFLFVPITIGLSAIVAGYETAWLRTAQRAVAAADEVLRQAVPDQLRHRRGHRHRAGVPVRDELERLLALRRRHLRRAAGDRGAARVLPRVDLPRAVDLRLGPAARASCTLACIWLVHVGTLFSAYFILAANSWMQHPVGYSFNPETGRAEMNDFAAVLFNKVQLVTFPHVVLSAYMTGGAFVVGVAFWQLTAAPRRRGRGHVPHGGPHRRGRACWSPASASPITGDIQGKIMTELQPMKMAAAEALYETEQPAPLLDPHHRHPRRLRGDVLDQDPRLLSFLATGTTDGEVEGINELRERVPGDLRPGPRRGVLLPRRLHAEHPADLLDLPADDRLGLAAAPIAGWILLGHPARRASRAAG